MKILNSVGSQKNVEVLNSKLSTAIFSTILDLISFKNSFLAKFIYILVNTAARLENVEKIKTLWTVNEITVKETQPLVICFSGKRKCGKDYICARLKNIFEDEGLKVIIQGISYPLKQEFASLHNLDFEKLKTDGPYKEIYRKEMNAWGESVRSKKPYYFCRQVADSILDADVLIISDCRRLTDIEYFQSRFRNLRLIRVVSDPTIRELRGFRYTTGIDDQDTECALDNFMEWDYIIENNENHSEESFTSSSLFSRLKIFAIELLKSSGKWKNVAVEID